MRMGMRMRMRIRDMIMSLVRTTHYLCVSVSGEWQVASGECVCDERGRVEYDDDDLDCIAASMKWMGTNECKSETGVGRRAPQRCGVGG